MELLYMLIAFVAGGVTGYGYRTTVSNELAELRKDYAMEASVLRADVAKAIADFKAKL